MALTPSSSSLTSNAKSLLEQLNEVLDDMLAACENDDFEGLQTLEKNRAALVSSLDQQLFSSDEEWLLKEVLAKTETLERVYKQGKTQLHQAIMQCRRASQFMQKNPKKNPYKAG
jgi:hypothetical protein